MNTSPLKIGYCLSLSGALASNGKTARLAHQIWQENANKNGGGNSGGSAPRAVTRLQDQDI